MLLAHCSLLGWVTLRCSQVMKLALWNRLKQRRPQRHVTTAELQEYFRMEARPGGWNESNWQFLGSLILMLVDVDDCSFMLMLMLVVCLAWCDTTLAD